MMEITGAKYVSIEVREDGKVVWVNTEEGCQLRIQSIEKVQICDKRKKR